MTREDQRDFQSANALEQILDEEITKEAFEMLNVEKRPVFEFVDTALNSISREYLAARSERRSRPKARKLRREMEPFARALESFLLAVDDLSSEAMRSLNSNRDDDADTQLSEEAGDVHLPDVLCDLIVFSERFETWFRMPQDPKGPELRTDLFELVAALIDLYSKFIEKPPTHSAVKNSVYEGAPQSHAGLYVDLVVRALDPEIPPSRVSNTLKQVLKQRREESRI